MKFKIILIFVICFISKVNSQILTFDFVGLAGNEVSATSNFNNPNLTNSTITRGSGLTASNNGDRFNAISWASGSINNAVTGNDYMEFTISPSAGYAFNVTTIDINFQRSGTGPRGIALRSSTDGFSTNIDGEKTITDNTSIQAFSFTVNLTNNTTPITFRFYAWAESGTGTGGFEGAGNDISVNGSVFLNTPQPEINLTGNSITITNNDITPQIGDFTDFGALDVTSGSQANTFVIGNTGTAPLILSGAPIVSITGTNAADFTITANATSPVVNGGNTAFTITFNPSAVGLRTATVSIANNDSDENPYTFSIQGNGTTPCVAPVSQASNLTFSGLSSSTIGGAFSGTSASGYLVVQSTSATLGANPVDGTSYTSGDSIGSGVVIQSNSNTTFNATGLSATTTYYYFIFAYNNTACVGGETYNTTSPLNGNETTLAGPCLAEDFTTNIPAPTNWIGSDATRSTAAADYNSAPAAIVFEALNGFLTTDMVSYPTNLSFYLGRTGNTNAKTLNINISTTSQTGPFTTIQVFDHGNVPSGSYDQYTVDLSAYSGDANVWIQFEKVSGTTSPWRLDDIEVNCTSGCTPTHTITDFTPTTGPVASELTINGSGFTASSTVNINGLTATILSQTSTELIIEVPSGAATGFITVNENGCDLDSSTSFTLISESGSCTISSFTDLIISEVFDTDGGNGWYMELYNPTSTAIDLDAVGTDFEIERYGDIGNAAPDRTIDLIGIVPPNSTFLMEVGSAGQGNCTGVSTDYDDFGAGINENDEIRLTKNGNPYDVVYCPNEIGYSISRNNAASGPSSIYNGLDWTLDTTESCADLGTFNAINSTFPVVTSQPSDVGACASIADFQITATAGNSGALTYQWFFNNGTATSWTVVNAANLPLVTVNGETTNNLQLSGSISAYSGYQFYCLVTEGGSCSSASNAAQLRSVDTTWNGTTWSNGTPNNTILAVINGNYNTSIDGSFSACSLAVNASFNLIIGDNSYIEITNDIVNNGTLNVTDKGSVVQINDSASYINNGSTSVSKFTAPINDWYEYTYWSSPVTSETFGGALSQSNGNRRFSFIAANFVDSFYENNNDNTQTFGPAVDGVDDNNDVWFLQSTGDTMIPGAGYIASHSTAAMVGGQSEYSYTFNGELNNGVITSSIARNDSELNDNNWNLIGNPYPSAIDINAFFNENLESIAANGKLEGEIYLWSHSTAPSATTNGNEIYNFNVSDYAIVNGSGGVAGGDLNNDGTVDALDIPNPYIPSCQSFFIKYSDNPASTTGSAIFNNSMRVTGNNDQFFRTSATAIPNKFWLNVSSDFGVYNQILVSYINGATDQYDGSFYDSKKVNLFKSSIGLYSKQANDDNLKYQIQGKHTSDLNLDEIVPLGFKNAINAPTLFTFNLDKLEGDFLANNAIYLKDKYLGTYTDLKQTNYSFTSTTGEFTDRFEIVFKTESLSTQDFETSSNTFTMYENNSETLIFNTNTSAKIESITIYNTIGQVIFSEKTINNSTFELNSSKLSKAMYIAKITLDNQINIVKKAIKK